MQAELPHGSHRLVALARLETFVRFARVLQHEPAAIPRVLTVFLGPLGICHPAPVGLRFYLLAVMNNLSVKLPRNGMRLFIMLLGISLH